MGLKTYFHIKQTGRNIKQSWSTQLMTMLTVSLSVLIFTFFLLIYVNIMNTGDNLGDELRMILYLDGEVLPEEEPMYEKKITDFGDVEKIVFISRADAFERLREQLDEESDVLEDLGPDFLPPSIEVYPEKNFRNLSRLRQFSDYLTTLPGARKVQYGQTWVERFGYFIELLRVVVILSGILLVMATVFMVSSSIRLTVVAKEAELEVLRLVGANNKFIRTPLMIEAFLQGLLGSGLGILLLYLIFKWTQDHLTGPGFLNIFEFTFFNHETSVSIILISTLLCSGGSLFSIRKYMRI